MKNTNILRLMIPMFLFSVLLVAQPVEAKSTKTSTRLVKCEDSTTVYLVENNRSAKAFPDRQTFASYGYEFKNVETINCKPKFPYKLNGRVPNKHGNGFRLMKRVNDPVVYACEGKQSYSVCEKIVSEQDATTRYGTNWPAQIYETDARTMNMLAWHYEKASN